MVNTFSEMSLPLGIPAERINRQATSMSKPFSQVLAASLGLSVFVKGQQIGSSNDLVVDYENLPPRLKSPQGVLSWQNPEILTKQPMPKNGPMNSSTVLRMQSEVRPTINTAG